MLIQNFYNAHISLLTNLGFIIAGFCLGIYYCKHRGIPPMPAAQIWSIGIYEGNSPFAFFPSRLINNPALTAQDVTDCSAAFVADPFMVNHIGNWYMFFEVMDAKTNKGSIGLATSGDGIHWSYQKIVLSELFHLSFPYVFKIENDYYMIPETCFTNSVRLYKAKSFPTEWFFEKPILFGRDFVDSVAFEHKGYWWLFTTTVKSNELRLYYAADIKGQWTEHPKSPVVGNNPYVSRPAGRVLTKDGKIYRYAQSVKPSYGLQVYMLQITKLTIKDYEEKLVDDDPILKPSGEGWNAQGMHHIDVHETRNGSWLACVDGHKNQSLTKRRILWLFTFVNYALCMKIAKYITKFYGRFQNKFHNLIRQINQKLGRQNGLKTPDRKILEKKILPYFQIDDPLYRMLFVGCDWYTKDYEKIFKGSDYWTIDIDASKKKYGASQHIIDSVKYLDKHFAPESIDLIICNGVIGWGLDLRAEAEEVFEKCWDCLKPNGILVLGWNDVIEHRPFDLSKVQSLKKFYPYTFPPLSTDSYLAEGDNRHTFNFFQKR